MIKGSIQEEDITVIYAPNIGAPQYVRQMLTSMKGEINNNAINEIKNTLEATNSRITEAEGRISELEDRMVEINESERKNKNELKEIRTTSETYRTMLNASIFES